VFDPEGVMAAVKPIPEGYPQVTPYLVVDGAGAAIEFYGKVFGTRERMRLPGPDGTIGHAELQLGDSLIMVADEAPQLGIHGPRTVGGTPVTISVYVEDVDGVFERAVQAGATALRPVEDHFYGDRSGQFEDPFGHRWSIATHVADVSPEEMGRRAADLADG
jgi:PhnB protein